MSVSASLFFSLFAASATAGLSDMPCEDGQAGPYPCSRVDLAAFIPIENIGGEGQSLNDVWGWTHEPSGREFAVVGRSGGTSFVEVTEPTNPIYLGDLPTRSLTLGGPQLLAPVTDQPFCHDDCDAPGGAWRDAKVYADHAFIVSEESGHGMQIFDLTRLLEVEPGEPETFDEDAHYDGFGNAHNLELNKETGRAYAVGTSNDQAEHNYNGGPHVVDVVEPLNPQHLGGYGEDGYTHDAQCVIYRGPDVRYENEEICFNSNENSLTLVGFSDPASPEQISRTTYDRIGYTHQGWLSEDQRWFYLNDELADQNDNSRTRTVVFDVSDLESVEVAYEYYSPDLAIAHNNYVKGDHLFQSNYTSGLRVLDISSPDRPVEVAYLDSQPGREDHAFQGSWSNYPWFESGTVLFTDISDGLFIVRPQLPDPAEGESDLSLTGMIESHGESDRNFSLVTRVIVENTGPEAAEGVEFVASLPESGALSLTGESPGDCDTNDRVLRCRYGSLGSGESFVVDLSAEADEAADEGLMVWAMSDRHDPDTGNNRLVLPRDGQASQPIAAFSYDCDALVCEFDASDSLGGSSELESLSWDLGDGQSQEGEVITHEYTEGGEYTVTLTVSNEAGEQAERSRSLTVSAPADDSSGSSSSSGCSLASSDRIDLTLWFLILALAGFTARRACLRP